MKEHASLDGGGSGNERLTLEQLFCTLDLGKDEPICRTVGVNSPVNKGMEDKLSALQRRIVSFPRLGSESLFVEGVPGTGKSTALMSRLASLLREGRRPYEILVLVPQRAQVERFERAISGLRAPTRGGVDILTFNSLARRSVALFWPLVARPAGFGHPEREATFLTIETAQYYMWRLVQPLMDQEGYFSDVAIRRERLLSQLIDNVNKSALVGFDHSDIYNRLRGAWTGSPDHLHRYWQAQDCALRFRAYCLAHNLLDFSLTTEVFHRYLFPHAVYRNYFSARYRHLLVDNLEENVPVAQDLIGWAIPRCASSVLALDDGGGHRIFLGADARGAQVLGEHCTQRLRLEQTWGCTPDLLALSRAITTALKVNARPSPTTGSPAAAILDQGGGKYWISMIRWVAERIHELVEGGAAPDQIAIVAPYVSEVMRFAVDEELGRYQLKLHLLRPATPLREDPIVRGILVLALLAHPDWTIDVGGAPYKLPLDDVALALRVALAELDPIRARRLAARATMSDAPLLADLTTARAGVDQRDLGNLWRQVGYQVRECYSSLQEWVAIYRSGEAEHLDLWLMRLFGDLLSRPGFGLFNAPERARAYGRLVESVAKFRKAVGEDPNLTLDPSREYVQLTLGGIASAEYLLDWPRDLPADAISLSPALTYLTREMRSRYQFWIDLGSDGWWNRPNQPLTQPYVLSRNWPVGQLWRDVEDEQAKREALAGVVRGLTHRCAEGVYLGYSELGIDGTEQKGRLQRAIVTALLGKRHVG